MDLNNMKKILKRLLKKLFFLPPVLALLVSVPAYALVIYVLTDKNVNPAVAYAAYLLSAYALVISVAGVIRALRSVHKGTEEPPLVRKLSGIPVVDRYLGEERFRAEAALYPGLAINLFYAGIKMFLGIYYNSVWFITLAAYYILLAIMRFSLLHYMRKPGKCQITEWIIYRLCGIILLFMNFVLAGIIILVICKNSRFEYPGILIYAMAMYAFYAIIIAVRDMVKSKRYGNPAMSAAKAVNMTAAMVSMLSLEIAMLARFGPAGSQEFSRFMTVCTGAGVSLAVLGMAVFMIVRSTGQLKHIKQEKEI